MLTFIAQRLIIFLPTLFVVSVLVFLLISLVPGDPVSLMLGMEADASAIALVREQLGLNDPWHLRFGRWLTGVLRGDLGYSYFLSQPVTQALLDRLPVTFYLSTMALTIAVVLGGFAGTIAAVRHGTSIDWGIMLVAMIGLSVPGFWLALNFIFVFSVNLRWFPVGGYIPLNENPTEFFRHLFLPALSLGLIHAAVIARMTRSSVLEILRTDYVRTARSKGLQERIVVYKHALRNALIPVVTVVGISVGVMLGGSVIIETVFSLPGVGRLIVDAVRRRDYPVIQGGLLLLTITYLIVNLIVDLLYVWINPRIRYT